MAIERNVEELAAKFALYTDTNAEVVVGEAISGEGFRRKTPSGERKLTAQTSGERRRLESFLNRVNQDRSKLVQYAYGIRT